MEPSRDRRRPRFLADRPDHGRPIRREGNDCSARRGRSLCWTIILHKFVSRIAKIAAGPRARSAGGSRRPSGAGDGPRKGPAGMSRTVVKAAALSAWRDRDQKRRKRAPISGSVSNGSMRDALAASSCAASKLGRRFSRSTASAAPLIGLFGTVWGIIHCFHALSPESGHQPLRRRPRHRRGPVRDRARPRRRHPGRLWPTTS